MNLLETAKKPLKKEEESINDLVFYSEIINIIESHLKCFCDDIPSISLAYYVNKFCNPEIIEKQDDLLDREIIINDSVKKCFANNENYINCNSSIIKNIINNTTKIKKLNRISDSKRLFFVEEIRLYILSALSNKKFLKKSQLRKEHLLIHLLELYYSRNNSLFDKVNEFLNTNFSLDDDDLIGNACRGNFGNIINIKPELTDAIESYLAIKRNHKKRLDSILKDSDEKDSQEKIKKSLIEWKNTYSIPNELITIFFGEYKDFKHEMEEYCYCLAYEKPTNYTNEHIEILKGNFSQIYEKSNSWLKLVFMIATTAAMPLRKYEKIFEEIFLEILEFDYQTALDFLSYSRANGYYFNAVIEIVNLNNVTVENLLRFASKNNVDNKNLLLKYCSQLQENQEWANLCKFLILKSVNGFKYTRESMTYFIENFAKYKNLMDEHFLNDKANLFVFYMQKIESLSYEQVIYLIDSEYFKWFVSEIIERILEFEFSDEFLLIKCLSRLVCSEMIDQKFFQELKTKIVNCINTKIQTK